MNTFENLMEIDDFFKRCHGFTKLFKFIDVFHTKNHSLKLVTSFSLTSWLISEVKSTYFVGTSNIFNGR